MNLRSLILSLVFSLFTLTASAQIDNFTDLQNAITAASDGETIIIAPSLIQQVAESGLIFHAGNITLSAGGEKMVFGSLSQNAPMFSFLESGPYGFTFDGPAVFENISYNDITNADSVLFHIAHDPAYPSTFSFGDNSSFSNNDVFSVLFQTSGNSIISFGNDTIFENNNTYNGVLYSKRASFSFGDGLVFRGNTSANSSGAAVHTEYSGSNTFYVGKNSIFDNNSVQDNVNSALQGGAIYFSGGFYDPAGSKHIDDGAIFSGNFVSGSNALTAQGGAIANTGSQIVIGDDVKFTGNYAKTTFESSTDAVMAQGGAIYSQNSTTVGNNALFEGNYASVTNATGLSGGSGTVAQGGAVWVNGTFSVGNNAQFIGNHASFYTDTNVNHTVQGGAIYASGGSPVNIGDDALFRGNYVDSTSVLGVAQGGAIYGGNSASFTFGNNVRFENNYAGLPLSAMGLGGAIFGQNGGFFTYNGDAVFSGNTSSLQGGAIYNENGVNHTFNGLAIFETNGVNLVNGGSPNVEGGAITSKSGAYLTFNGDALFRGNYLKASNAYSANGGGLYVMSAAPTIFNKNVWFDGNTITLTSTSDTTTAQGGGMFINQSYEYQNFVGDVIFTNNIISALNDGSGPSSTADGGGLYYYATSSNNVIFGGNTTFINNSATAQNNARGGALFYAGGNGIDFSNGKAYFEGNHVKSTGSGYGVGGGAIYARAPGSILFGDDTVFLNNYAETVTNAYGGAVYIEGSSGIEQNHIFGRNTIFQNNGIITAYNSVFGSANVLRGGGLYVNTQTGLTFLEDSKFINNYIKGSGVATSVGGAAADMRFLGNGATFGRNALFSGNNIDYDFRGTSAYIFAQGGAVSAESTGLGVSFGGYSLFDNNGIKLNFNSITDYGSFTAQGGFMSAISGNATYNNGNTFQNNYITVTGSDTGSSWAEFAGGAVYGMNTTLTFGSNNTFVGNKVDSTLFNHTATNFYDVYGGAVAVYQGSAVFGDNAIFADNSALSGNNGVTGWGGAVWSQRGTLTFNGAAKFYNNHASRGGGAVAGTSGGYTFNGIAYFEANHAGGANVNLASGGALASVFSTDDSSGFTGTLFGYSYFYDNYASATLANGADNIAQGGAIFYDANTSFVFNANAEFIGNYVYAKGNATNYAQGGALWMQGGGFGFNNIATPIFANNYAKAESFTGSTAYAQGGAWGAVNAGWSVPMYAVFFNNSVSAVGGWIVKAQGGALYASGSGGGFNGNVLFEGNSAFVDRYDGANGSNEVSAQGGAVWLGNGFSGGASDYLTFRNNSVKAANPVSLALGGGMYLLNASFGFGNYITFDGNQAIANETVSYSNGNAMGGALYVGNLASASFSQFTQFLNNSSTAIGGAVWLGQDYATGNYSDAGGSVNFGSDVLFDGNTAGLRGGAVYAFNQNALSFGDRVIFNNNSVTARNVNAGSYSRGISGGALYVFNNNAGHNINFGSNATFMGNSVRYEILDSKNSTFSAYDNNALGGALWLYSQSDLKFAGNTAFINNSAYFSYVGNGTVLETSSPYAGGGAVNYNLGMGTSALDFGANAYFEGNSATSVVSSTGGTGQLASTAIGGAVFAYDMSSVNFGSDTVFKDNIVSASLTILPSNANGAINAKGGAAALYYSHEQDVLSFGERTLFTGNKALASISGNGVIYTHSYGNSGAHGGAMFHYNSANGYALQFGADTTFVSNSAELRITGNFTGSGDASPYDSDGISAKGGAFMTGYSADPINFGDRTVFLNNSALAYMGQNVAVRTEVQGGAAWLNYGTVVFGQDSVFQGNKAWADYLTSTFVGTGSGTKHQVTGGAVFAVNVLDLQFGDGTKFIDNSVGVTRTGDGNWGFTADVMGGALFSGGSKVSFGNNILFADNKAGLNFAQGKGGAIYFNDYAGDGVNTFGDNAVFYNNQAGFMGGAIFNYGSDLVFNTGALFELNSIIFNFKTTSAAVGGAIYNRHTTNSDYGDIVFNGDATFRGNTIISFYYGAGGAVFNDTQGGYGAYLTAKAGADLVFDGNNITSGGKAFGGALYNQGGSTMEFTGTAVFANNSATVFNTGDAYALNSDTPFATGGAIFNNGGTITADWTSAAFLNNRVTSTVSGSQSPYVTAEGGAIVGGNYTFGDNARFEGNYATVNLGARGNLSLLAGGAISGRPFSTTANFGSNALFLNNYIERINAGGSGYGMIVGGAMAYGTATFGEDAQFVGNRAISRAGLVSQFVGGVFAHTTLSFGNGAQFFNNYLQMDQGGAQWVVGGAIGVTANNGFFNNVNDVIFQNNYINLNVTQGMGSFNAWGGAMGDFNSSFGDNAQFNNNGITVRWSANAASSISEVHLYGGALQNWNVMTFGADTVFAGNYIKASGIVNSTGDLAQFHGGALFAQEGATFSDGVVFYGNTVDATAIKTVGPVSIQGGGIRANGLLTFNGGAHFEQNSALGAGATGGAIHMDMNGRANFNGAVDFLNNTSTYGGGAISRYGAQDLNFYDAARFFGNSSSYGGAIYSSSYGSNSVIRFFEDSTVAFVENTALIAGGAVFTMDAILDFDGTETVFISNSSKGQGGAVYTDGSIYSNVSTSFSGDVATFGLNRAGTNGGAVANVKDGTIYFEDAQEVLFSSNTAGGLGGAIYSADTGSYVGFYNSKVDFEGNNARSGGAVYNSSSVYVDRSDISFLGNTAFEYGGAYYGDGAASNFSYGAATTLDFTANRALRGGAIALTNGATMTINNAKFEGNYAGAAGGAVYLDGSTITFNTGADQTTEFKDNGANGLSNALHIGNNATANFHSVENGDINMYDGMTSGTTNSLFYFDGEGEFYNYGYAQLNNVTINGGGFTLMDGGAFASTGLWQITTQGVFNAANDVTDIMRAQDFTNNGLLKMDVFKNELSDQIVAAGAVTLGSGSVLDGITDISDNNFRKKIYKIINYGTLSGQFGTVYLNGADPLSLVGAYQVDYGTVIPEWIILAIDGAASSSSFADLNGLSFNQTAAANTLDNLSVDAVGDLDTVISLIDAGNEADQKRALGELSPYFTANVISSRSMTYARTDVYDRIYNHCVGVNCDNTGFWVQAQGGVKEYKDTPNSLDKFKVIDAGAVFGFDKFNVDNGSMLGILGRYNDGSLEQGANEADTQSVGAGVYGGFVKEKWELKAMLGANYDTYSTTRKLALLDRTASGSFSGFTGYADAEFAYKFNLSKAFALKPYAGLNASYSMTKDFVETGAGAADLKVDAADFLQTSARAGLGLGNQTDKFNWYVSGGVNAILTGAEPELNATFYGTQTKFKSRGFETDNLVYEGRLGVGYNVGKNVKLYANGAYLFGDNYTNYNANLGIRIGFCEPKQTEVREVVREVIQYVDNPAPLQVGSVVEITSGYFAFDSAQLDPTLRRFLAQKAQELKAIDFNKLIITGHTDDMGAVQHNIDLSERRARAVADFLVEQGVPAEKIGTHGKGHIEPKYDNTTAEGRALNRRVEMVVE